MALKWLDFYQEITKTCPFNTSPSESFYYTEQDHLETDLLVRNCIEIDISSAFPSLCKFLFGENHPLVQKIFSFDNKFERNKFIAISLTHQNYNINLKALNSWCKFIILGYIYNNFTNVNIIEYKKDGALFTGIYKYDEASNEFNSYIEDEINIKFHIEKVSLYVRFNKTSIFQYNNKVSVKGKYKEPPEFIKDLINNNSEMNNIKLYYSDFFCELLKLSNLTQEIQYYYKFNGKFIQRDGSLSFELSSPKNILIYFIYPLLSIIQLEKNSTL